jgi:hypothetical protein
MSKTFLSVAVVMLLLCSAQACKCIQPSYADTFNAAVSVHKVKVLQSLSNGKFYKVKRLVDYKGCGERPKYFKVKDSLAATDCQSKLTVGSSYLVHLDGSKYPSIFLYCKNDQDFAGLSAEVLSYLSSNHQCY